MYELLRVGRNASQFLDAFLELINSVGGVSVYDMASVVSPPHCDFNRSTGSDFGLGVSNDGHGNKALLKIFCPHRLPRNVEEFYEIVVSACSSEDSLSSGRVVCGEGAEGDSGEFSFRIVN
jgi:hypothetical protein